MYTVDSKRLMIVLQWEKYYSIIQLVKDNKQFNNAGRMKDYLREFNQFKSQDDEENKVRNDFK